MNIGLISGSPKIKSSVSGYLLEKLESYFTSEEVCKFKIYKPEIEHKDLEKIKEMDTLIFFFPLYVDSLPSHLVKALSIIEEEGIKKNINIYAVVNCGFIEGEQCSLAFDIMKNWSIKCGFSWKEGLGIGGSGIIRQKREPGKNLSMALRIIASDIKNGKGKENMFVSPSMPKIFYKIGAEIGWRKKIKANGLRKKELFTKL